MGTRALITVVLPDGTSFNHYQHCDEQYGKAGAT